MKQLRFKKARETKGNEKTGSPAFTGTQRCRSKLPFSAEVLAPINRFGFPHEKPTGAHEANRTGARFAQAEFSGRRRQERERSERSEPEDPALAEREVMDTSRKPAVSMNSTQFQARDCLDLQPSALTKQSRGKFCSAPSSGSSRNTNSGSPHPPHPFPRARSPAPSLEGEMFPFALKRG